MTAPRTVADYVQDMFDNAEKARGFVHDVDFETFSADEQKIYAVVRALEVIGEAARHVPKHIRAQYPAVPWRKVTGTRDKVIHDYFGVDLQVVWKTLHRDLPALQAALTSVLADLNAQEDNGTKDEE